MRQADLRYHRGCQDKELPQSILLALSEQNILENLLVELEGFDRYKTVHIGFSDRDKKVVSY